MKETISMRPASASTIGLFSPPAITGVPRITESILREAHVWTKFACVMGARFSVETEAQSAIEFSARAGMSGFVLPSKFEGTSRFQPNIRDAAEHLDEGRSDAKSRRLRLKAQGSGRVTAGFGRSRSGFTSLHRSIPATDIAL